MARPVDNAAMTTIRQRGGARIGWVGASWPLAGIEVGPGRARITSLGTYEFTPAEVSAVEEVGTIPFISQGVRIHHSKPRYPEEVVFYPPTGRQALLAAFRESGFNVGSPALQVRRGFPLRVRAVLAVALLWNVLLMLEQPQAGPGRWVPGPYLLAALGMLFAIATLLPRSVRLQSFFMRAGRDVGEVSSVLRLVQLVCGFLLLGFAAAHLVH